MAIRQVAFGRCLLWAVGIHAVIVFVGLVLNFLTVWMGPQSPGILNTVADLWIRVACRPLMPLVAAGRIDVFFVLLPLNSVVYGLVVCVPVTLLRRVVARSSRPKGRTRSGFSRCEGPPCP